MLDSSFVFAAIRTALLRQKYVYTLFLVVLYIDKNKKSNR